MYNPNRRRFFIRAFWLITIYNIINLLIYTFTVYWLHAQTTAIDLSLFNISYLLLVIVIHASKALVLLALFIYDEIGYYLQIIVMFSSVIGWILVLPHIKEVWEPALILVMVLYTVGFFTWLHQDIRKYYLFDLPYIKQQMSTDPEHDE